MTISCVRRPSTLTNILASATATTLVAEPLGRWLTVRGSLDVPNHRSSHTAPTPRGGGLAALVGATAAAAISGSRPSTGGAVSVAALAAVGWADDVTGQVPVLLRLAAQAGVGAMGLSRSRADRATASVVTSTVVNAVNFMDGINGISALTGLVWGLNALLLDDESSGDLQDFGALTVGASLGFLPHNAPRAKLFLGDVGSYALGTAMAAGILSQRSLRNRYRVAAPLLLYGVDTGQAILRRAIAGRQIGEAHRDHIYQRLVDAGQAHHHVALIHALAAGGVATASRLGRWNAPLTIGICALYLGLPRASAPNKQICNRPAHHGGSDTRARHHVGTQS